MFVSPWTMEVCYASAACHLGFNRNLAMIKLFFWWIKMDICTQWWRRGCLKCQTRKNFRNTVRWPIHFVPLPHSPGVEASVGYFRPLPMTAHGNAHILLFTNHSSGRADIIAVIAIEFTAAIFVNRYTRR